MVTVVVDASVWVSAADPSDRFHKESRRFLEAIVRRQPRFLLPAIARLEVACALARRLGDGERALALTAAIFSTPLIQHKGLDRKLMETALDRGIRLQLKGADALYAAVSHLAGCKLISWDRDLVDRAGAIRPSEAA